MCIGRNPFFGGLSKLSHLLKPEAASLSLSLRVSAVQPPAIFSPAVGCSAEVRDCGSGLSNF